LDAGGKGRRVWTCEVGESYGGDEDKEWKSRWEVRVEECTG